jgi:hypothetical protein
MALAPDGAGGLVGSDGSMENGRPVTGRDQCGGSGEVATGTRASGMTLTEAEARLRVKSERRP